MNAHSTRRSAMPRCRCPLGRRHSSSFSSAASSASSFVLPATGLLRRGAGRAGRPRLPFLLVRRLAHQLLGIGRPAELEGVDRDLLPDGAVDPRQAVDGDPDGRREPIVVEGIPSRRVAGRIALVRIPVVEAHVAEAVEEHGAARTGAIHPTLAERIGRDVRVLGEEQARRAAPAAWTVLDRCR